MSDYDNALIEIVRARKLATVNDVVNDLVQNYNIISNHKKVSRNLNTLCVNRQGYTALGRIGRTEGRTRCFVYYIKGAEE